MRKIPYIRRGKEAADTFFLSVPVPLFSFSNNPQVFILELQHT